MTTLYRVRSTINYGAGGPGLGTHYFLPGTPGGSIPDAQLAANGVRAFWNAFAAQFANTVAVLVQGGVDTISDTSGGLIGGFTVAPPAAVVGTGIAPYLPVFTSLVMRYQTGTIVRGRRLSGRTFVGPLCTAAAVSGLTPTVAAGTAGTNAVAALLAVVGPIPYVWSRPDPTRGIVGTSGPVIGGSIDSFFGSLRSRRD